MSGKATIQYILFEFITGWEPGSGFPIAVLALDESDSGPQRVHLHVAADWKAHVPEPAIPFLEDTFADWESLNLGEAVDLFSHLAQSGAGPLQAGTSGTCSYAELRAILKRELGIGPV